MTGEIFPQTGDDINETSLGRTMALSHQTDYVENGLGFFSDFQANTLDISSGHAIIRDGQDARHVLPDQEFDIPLPVTSGVNYIYLVADFTDTTTDSVTYQALSSDSPPTNTSLKIGEVDTSADTSTEMNRSAPLNTEDLDASTLGGNGPGYYAPINSPTFTGTPSISGVGSTLQVGLDGQGGPHGFKFGNNTGEDVGFLGFRTGPDEVTIENFTTGTTIASFPIDGTTQPQILGQDVRTLQDGNEQPNITVGSTAPQNPDDGDVWIDTS